MEKNVYLEKLESIYKQFVNASSRNPYDFHFRIICKEFGLLNPIKAKAEDELNEDKVLYRGVGKKRKYMVNLVCETNQENIFIGDGVYGNGIYCTKDFTSALNEYANKKKKNVIKMYLDECNIVVHWKIWSLQEYLKYKFRLTLGTSLSDESIETVNELTESNENLKWFLEYLENKNDIEERKNFLQTLVSYGDQSTLAAILGYDALHLASHYKPHSNKAYLILNRGKLSVEKRFHKVLDRKYKRISKSAKTENQNAEEIQKTIEY